MQCDKQACNSEELSTEEEKNSAADWWTKAPQTDDVCHFENVQSTNWNTMRFKSPPAHDTDIGWRVEFRPLDIQLTDFENSAYTVLVGMMANIINQFSLDFVIPISLVDEGMASSHFQDAL
jgi:glutamate--cysteine ligase catalytic subunit